MLKSKIFLSILFYIFCWLAMFGALVIVKTHEHNFYLSSNVARDLFTTMVSAVVVFIPFEKLYNQLRKTFNKT